MLPFTLLWVLGCAFSKSVAVPTLRARTVVSESAWRKPNITQPLSDLITTASAALVKAVNGASTADQFNGQTFEVVATTYFEMAEFDMLTNQTQYEESLQQSFSRTQEQRPNFQDTELNFGLTYGYAAARAYNAYQNSTFLDFAIQSWSFGRSYTLSQGSTTLPVKNFTVEGSCNGATMVGGTFWTTTISDPDIAAMSTGYFMLLSALLSEATSNSVYLQAATDSANFIHSQLYSTNGFVLEIISGSANDTCKIINSAVDSFNSGLFIEGLAVLVSQTHDATMQTWLETLITNVLSSAPWSTTTGIIANGGDKNGDAILVRALLAAYLRNVTTPAIRQNLRDYIAVQFNAVIDLATNGGDIYADQWTGPPSSSFSLNNQTNALSPLLSAAYVIASDEAAAASSASSPSGSASSSTASATSSATPPATIAGATIAGVFIVALAIVVIVIFRRRVQARRLTAPAPMSTSQPVLSPSGYSLPASYSVPTSNASQPLSDPSFAHPSDVSLPQALPTHASAPPSAFSFIPRSYVLAEKGRPPPRHVSRLSQISGTASTEGSSYGQILSDAGADAGSPVYRDSRVLRGGEEPPPEYDDR
ncbi:hypothetical protein C8R45DRAFT_1040419 [Mycena sanguinolenta]|nr:hypothetical protein C8R45DRAFT_1040419 [Mycena sanguinolenta]